MSHSLLVYDCTNCRMNHESESESCITTEGQSASLSWNIAPVWGLRPDFYSYQTAAGLLLWGAISGERTGLSFTLAPGPRQCSNFRVRVPWESWSYFTVSDSRLPYSSPPTTCRVTVKVFDPPPYGSLNHESIICPSIRTSGRFEYR
jgi:hypothetical protein